MSQTSDIPRTRSGACVSCGAYGNSAHSPNCANRPLLGLQLFVTRTEPRHRCNAEAMLEKHVADLAWIRGQ